jgi:hypothetical protein
MLGQMLDVSEPDRRWRLIGKFRTECRMIFVEAREGEFLLVTSLALLVGQMGDIESFTLVFCMARDALQRRGSAHRRPIGVMRPVGRPIKGMAPQTSARHVMAAKDLAEPGQACAIPTLVAGRATPLLGKAGMGS